MILFRCWRTNCRFALEHRLFLLVEHGLLLLLKILHVLLDLLL